nr:MAG TPA_asm: hypothetical protein [Caudoviricetes sp.]
MNRKQKPTLLLAKQTSCSSPYSYSCLKKHPHTP